MVKRRIFFSLKTISGTARRKRRLRIKLLAGNETNLGSEDIPYRLVARNRRIALDITTVITTYGLNSTNNRCGLTNACNESFGHEYKNDGRMQKSSPNMNVNADWTV
jgi:hypothetical protein